MYDEIYEEVFQMRPWRGIRQYGFLFDRVLEDLPESNEIAVRGYFENKVVDKRLAKQGFRQLRIARRSQIIKGIYSLNSDERVTRVNCKVTDKGLEVDHIVTLEAREEIGFDVLQMLNRKLGSRPKEVGRKRSVPVVTYLPAHNSLWRQMRKKTFDALKFAGVERLDDIVGISLHDIIFNFRVDRDAAKEIYEKCISFEIEMK